MRVNQKLTFGLEAEAHTASPAAPNLAATRNFRRWRDATIREDNGAELPRERRGVEFITNPLLANFSCGQDGRDLKVEMGESEAIVHDLFRCLHHVNQSCGVHTHLGRPDKSEPLKSRWEPEKVRTFLAIGLALEDKLFNLVPPSRRVNQYCKKISECYTPEDLTNYYPTGEVHPHKRQNAKRYCWLNLIETRRVGTRVDVGFAEGPATGTIEIRLLGNTGRATYAVAWTKLWLAIAGLVAYVPTSLAILHCVNGTTLRPFFEDVERQRQLGAEL